MSSFGESQRLCSASERQDRSPDYPDAAEPSPLDVLVSDGTGLVKSEILKPNRGGRITHLLEDDSDELEAIRAAAVEAGMFMQAPNGEDTNLTEQTTENPVATGKDGHFQKGPAQDATGSSVRRLAAYRPFVEKEMQPLGHM